MAMPVWALLLLVGIPLLQIPLVLYLSRWFELDGDAPLSTPARAYWTDGEGGTDGGGRAPGVPGRCARCGTLNDPTYDFCGRCVAPL